MRTVGIDLAADPGNTALCTIDWVTASVGLLEPPVTDDRIVEMVAGCDMAAIDVPLGQPDAFVEAIVAHRDGAAWPPIAHEPPADRTPLRFRVTDLTIQGGGAKPLSVSTNWIGVTALRGARLQHLLRAAGVPVERSGTSGTVLEAYPAAALREWDLQHSGYKRAKNAKARQQLTSAVIDQCGPFASAVEAWLSTRAEP